jgi:hypothetical protein
MNFTDLLPNYRLQQDHFLCRFLDRSNDPFRVKLAAEMAAAGNIPFHFQGLSNGKESLAKTDTGNRMVFFWGSLDIRLFHG